VLGEKKDWVDESKGWIVRDMGMLEKIATEAAEAEAEAVAA
jgi:hypothetical protein